MSATRETNFGLAALRPAHHPSPGCPKSVSGSLMWSLRLARSLACPGARPGFAAGALTHKDLNLKLELEWTSPQPLPGRLASCLGWLHRAAPLLRGSRARCSEAPCRDPRLSRARLRRRYRWHRPTVLAGARAAPVCCPSAGASATRPPLAAGAERRRGDSGSGIGGSVDGRPGRLQCC